MQMGRHDSVPMDLHMVLWYLPALNTELAEEEPSSITIRHVIASGVLFTTCSRR
jgi:hypothetical protein